jgi:hypothetical protein
LRAEEDRVRGLSVALVNSDNDLVLHFRAMEAAMNAIDAVRQAPIVDRDDEDMKLLALRMFNMMACSQSLALCGYAQCAAMLARDLLETVFLVDLFSRDCSAIKRWREASTSGAKSEFKPVAVRKKLDDLDGFTSGKRGKLYKLFCELAAHPTPGGAQMLRAGNGLAHGGPFHNPNGLRAVVAELGRLAIQIGEKVLGMVPPGNTTCQQAEKRFLQVKGEWVDVFYS